MLGKKVLPQLMNDGGPQVHVNRLGRYALSQFPEDIACMLVQRQDCGQLSSLLWCAGLTCLQDKA